MMEVLNKATQHLIVVVVVVFKLVYCFSGVCGQILILKCFSGVSTLIITGFLFVYCNLVWFPALLWCTGFKHIISILPCVRSVRPLLYLKLYSVLPVTLAYWHIMLC